jgi:hypothetical protein
LERDKGGVKDDPERIVLIEAMGFTWKLPFSVVVTDLASGFAIMVQDPVE